ncbi:MAG: carbohydrate-binding protein [Paludibacteraceae bacterium]|nr:carbohydrate-binding protein [Paludibacteraceae bacterium]
MNKSNVLGLFLASALSCTAGNVIHNGTFNTGTQGWKVINGGDCMTWSSTEGNSGKGAMVVTNSKADPESVWSTQIECEFTTPLPEGAVNISYAIKCKTGTGTMRASIAGVGHYEADQSITTTFKTVNWSFNAKGGETGLCFDLGAVANTYIIDDVKVMFGSASSGNKCTPPLHVDGKYMKDPNGNKVVLHGVMDTPSMWFNSDRWTSWDIGGYVPAACPRAQAYFTKIFDAITDNAQGAYCDIFRLHMEPAWVRKDNVKANGEADLATTYDRDKVKYYLENLFLPIAKDANEHGLYVIMRPPGVCPGDIQVGDAYQKYLLDVWDIVSQNQFVKDNAGWLSIELANEPVRVKDASGNRPTDGQWGPANGPAKTQFFQPIIDKIRKNGFTGIIWVPGEGYQSSYESYAKYPISDNNFGYAIHVYSGWYGQSDDNCSTQSFITNMQKQVPGITSKPVVITECDWSPGQITGTNFDGSAKSENYGTWATAKTSTWGNALKGMMDHFGNMSITLTSTDVYVDMDTYIKTGKVQPAFMNKPKPEEASGVACFKWFKEWAQVDKPTCEPSSSISIALTASAEEVLLPSTITLKANANSDNKISNVIFYDGDDILGKVASAPFTITTEGMTPGKHTVYAFVTDEKTYSAYDSVVIFIREPEGPFGETAIKIPGKVEAEYFNRGGEGVGYTDTDAANNGGEFRKEGVDIKANADGGYRLGWTVKDEWLKYAVNVETEGYYNVSALVSTDNETASFHLELDDEPITETVAAAKTDDWDVLKTVTTKTITKLPKGEHTLKLVIDGSYFDIDWLNLELAETTSSAVIDADGTTAEVGTYSLYNVLGSKLGEIDVQMDVDVPMAIKGLAKGNKVVVLKSNKTAKAYKVVIR